MVHPWSSDACARAPGGSSAFLDICEIRVNRNDSKGFVALAFDTTPGYMDTQPFPSAPVKWIYQAIYRVGDSRVGQWSKPVSVTVAGSPLAVRRSAG